MALHAKVDDDGTGTGYLPVSPLLDGEKVSIPKHRLPDGPMVPEMAYDIIHDELMLDGNAPEPRDVRHHAHGGPGREAMRRKHYRRGRRPPRGLFPLRTGTRGLLPGRAQAGRSSRPACRRHRVGGKEEKGTR